MSHLKADSETRNYLEDRKVTKTFRKRLDACISGTLVDLDALPNTNLSEGR